MRAVLPNLMTAGVIFGPSTMKPPQRGQAATRSIKTSLGQPKTCLLALRPTQAQSYLLLFILVIHSPTHTPPMAKNDLSSKTPPGPHAYEPLSASDDDRNWDRKSIETSIASSLPEEESEGTAARESHDRSRLRRTRIIAWIQGFVIVILLAAIVRQRLSDHRPPLGVDPTGFVPDHVGGPLRWTNYVDDENDPYFVTKDVFDNIDNVRTTAARLKAVHNCEYH